MGNDTNSANETDDSATADRVRELGRSVLNRGKRKAKELSTEAQQRLERYRDNPELLERELEALAAEGSRVGEDVKESIRSLGSGVGDGTARQLGWRDATEMVQAYGADSPAVDAYMETAPADVLTAGDRFDFARFDGTDFAPFQDAPLSDQLDDSLEYAVSVRSEAYLREHGEAAEGVFVEYRTDAETLDDINEETTVQVDFYTVD